MPDWLSLETVKGVLGPIATLVAAGVAAYFTSKQVAITNAQKEIARSQSEIALEKLKYDLFEKRYEIYQRTKKVLEHILSNLDFEKQNSEFIRASFVHMDESRFFFDRDIHSYLASIEADCHAVFDLWARRDACTTDDETWKQLNIQLRQKRETLKAIQRELPAKFENALAFKKLATPSA
jgi:hypothetical protein